jgi:hypothetical protein
MSQSLTLSEVEVLENVARELRHRAEVLEAKAQHEQADGLKDLALALENVVVGELRDA